MIFKLRERERERITIQSFIFHIFTSNNFFLLSSFSSSYTFFNWSCRLLFSSRSLERSLSSYKNDACFSLSYANDNNFNLTCTSNKVCRKSLASVAVSCSSLWCSSLSFCHANSIRTFSPGIFVLPLVSTFSSSSYVCKIKINSEQIYYISNYANKLGGQDTSLIRDCSSDTLTWLADFSDTNSAFSLDVSSLASESSSSKLLICLSRTNLLAPDTSSS